MRIITLNTWGGRAGRETLLGFFGRERLATDIFCLQEIWAAPYEQLEGAIVGGRDFKNEHAMTDGLRRISEMLPDHVPYFHPHHLDNYGLLMLVRRDITPTTVGEAYVHKHKGFIPEGDVGHHARNIQYATMRVGGKPVTIVNFHGLWNGQGKTDSADRLAQSRRIVDALKTFEGGKVFCGDFNLEPDTESLAMIEAAGMRNLVKEYGVTSTRTRLYAKPGKFADYVLVSPGIKVNEFRVLPDEVSDHAPLLLEFDV